MSIAVFTFSIVLLGGTPWGRDEPGIAAAADPTTIVSGTAVPTCAWPSVVELFDENPPGGGYGVCTGTYGGDRLILTAAHCVTPGFSLPAAPGGCTTAADCPSVSRI